MELERAQENQLPSRTFFQLQGEGVRAKYNGVAYFFRAYFFYEKVIRFGDVPWYDKVLEIHRQRVSERNKRRQKNCDGSRYGRFGQRHNYASSIRKSPA